MLFNLEKCKCQDKNLDVNYKMGNTVLGITVKEKDLGDTKVSEQSVVLQFQMVTHGLIRRNIT